jgi:hypothetical protein
VPSQKTIPPNQNKDASQRFTPDDIVCAIEGVEKAGLKIYSVEITLTGDIKITTGRTESRAASGSSADNEGPAKSAKK